MQDRADLPALTVSGLYKAFGETAVLSGFDLKVPRGQRLALIGGSGSGKTTLLRLVAGLERPDDGYVGVFGERLPERILAGRLIPRDPPSTPVAARRDVGMVFQHFNLFPHLTALENVIAAPVHAMGVARDQACAEGTVLLARFGLGAHAHAYPRNLSGGQQQRVAIVRALALKPRLMLFDEVTASLDVETVAEVLGAMRELAEVDGMTMMIVTHEMGFAREVADRVVFMDKGAIVEDAPPAKLFTAPEHPRTRAFLQAAMR